MTRKEYMEQLKKYLKRLPKDDYENAIEYFSEYFDEAGPEQEQQVMQELGEPKEAAGELLLHLLQESVGEAKAADTASTAGAEIPSTEKKVKKSAEKKTAEKKSSPGKIILLAFLVLCASPVSLALLMGTVCVLFAVVTVIAVVIFSLGVAGLAAIAGGILTTGFGATLILQSAAAACMTVGGGFLMAGAGILICVFTIYICKWCAMGIGRMVNRFVGKKVRKGE